MAADGAVRGGARVARGIAFAALGGICWGFSGTCAQLLTSEAGIPVAWITPVRLSAGALIFMAVCLVREPRNVLAALRDVRSVAAIFAFAMLGVLLTQVSYLSAIAYTNAGTGTVLERLGLVLIMLYACLRSRRLPRARELCGLVLALAGTVLIATKGNFGSLAIPPEGLMWGIVSAFALAFYTLIPVRVLEKWGSFIVTGMAMLFGGAVSMAAVRPWTIPVDVTPQVVVVMALMVVVGTFAAYLFYLQGINDAGPVRAGLVGCVEPVSATVISALWLGTPVSGVDVAGCALIIGMVFLVSQRTDASESAAAGTAPRVFHGRASELGYYRARTAVPGDVPRLREVLADGHRAMAALGIREDAKRYPSARRLARAVAAGAVYVVETSSADGPPDASPAAAASGGRIIGMFALDPAGDASYATATGVRWESERDGASAAGEGEDGPPYAALHWATVCDGARRRGVGSYMLGTAARIARDAGKRSIRADVYLQNGPMRILLARFGYEECGTIELHDRLGRTKRRAAYELIL